MKKILYILLLIILCLPLTLKIFPFIQSKRLSGVREKKEKPFLTSKTFFNGDFQDKYSDYFNDNVGFFTDLVRIYSQTYYSCFSVSVNKHVCLGKDKCIFGEDYVRKGIYGHFAWSDEQISTIVDKTAALQDTLNRLGKNLLIIFAPGKGSFNKEKQPWWAYHLRKFTTNYDKYIKYCDEKHVNYIDFKKYFIQQKDKTEYPLYSNTGVHWSLYGVYVVMDSLTHYYRNLFPCMPELHVKEFRKDDFGMFDEHDMFFSLNLIMHTPKQILCHPDIEFIDKDTCNVSCVFISDSYGHRMFNLGFMDHFFKNSEYWYYGRERMVLDENREMHGTKMQLGEKEIQTALSKDAIIFLLSDINSFGYLDNGFIDLLYNYFYNKKQ